MAHNDNRQQGFTLIELMVAIVIAGILIFMAVPSYQDFIKRNAVESMQSRFAAAVVTARTEAAARNVTTTLCSSSDGATCSILPNWSKGWIVFTDRNVIGKVDTVGTIADEIILSYGGSGNYGVNFQDENAAGVTPTHHISFNNQGFVVGNRAFATICEPAKDKLYSRGFTVERSGRVMKSRDSNNDNFHDFKFDKGDNINPTAIDLNCAFF